jgi:UPF0755 protein
MSRLLRWILALIVVLTLALIVSLLALMVLSGSSPGEFVRTSLARLSLMGRDTDLALSAGIDPTPRRFTVTFGDTPAAIADNLQQAGLILDAELFVAYARAEGLDSQFEAGTYFLNQTQPVTTIALTLTDSRNSFIAFRVLEGWRLEEIADIIDQNPLLNFSGADFLAAARAGQGAAQELGALTGLPSNTSLEGFLFPDSYQLPPDINVTNLIETLTNRFVEVVEPQWVADAAAQGLSMREVVTLASIVQREAVRVDEMPLVASVYRNRLRIGMKLDADPTVQYALGKERGAWWPRITVADYAGVNSPFNTYLFIGLPPSPINSPGMAAIRATVYPETTEYFFFRADCRDDGYHDFSRTFEEHLANGC